KVQNRGRSAYLEAEKGSGKGKQLISSSLFSKNELRPFFCSLLAMLPDGLKDSTICRASDQFKEVLNGMNMPVELMICRQNSAVTNELLLMSNRLTTLLQFLVKLVRVSRCAIDQAANVGTAASRVELGERFEPPFADRVRQDSLLVRQGNWHVP